MMLERGYRASELGPHTYEDHGIYFGFEPQLLAQASMGALVVWG